MEAGSRARTWRAVTVIALMFALSASVKTAPPAATVIYEGQYAHSVEVPDEVVVLCWNLARGTNLEALVQAIRAALPDICILQEVDSYARRTGGKNIAEEIARRLSYNYVFGVEYVELGEGTSNVPALHGQATLSRFPITDAEVRRYSAQSQFWAPRWFIPNWSFFQRRVGGRMVLSTRIEIGGQEFNIHNTHLESRGAESLRLVQTEQLLSWTVEESPNATTLIAGDLNTRQQNSPVVERLLAVGFTSAILEGQPTTAPRERPPFWRLSNLWDLLGLADGERLEQTLDWLFVRGRAVEIASGEVLTTVTGSDHYPLVARFRLSQTTK